MEIVINHRNSYSHRGAIIILGVVFNIRFTQLSPVEVNIIISLTDSAIVSCWRLSVYLRFSTPNNVTLQQAKWCSALSIY